MAYDPNELYSTEPGVGAQERVEATTIQPKTFASGTGTIKKLTPVTLNLSTRQWTIWDYDGGNGTDQIKGFVWSDDIELVSGFEVQGNVMLAGKLHFGDIVLPAGEVLAELEEACQDQLRDRGIIVQGLVGVH